MQLSTESALLSTEIDVIEFYSHQKLGILYVQLNIQARKELGFSAAVNFLSEAKHWLLYKFKVVQIWNSNDILSWHLHIVMPAVELFVSCYGISIESHNF